MTIRSWLVITALGGALSSYGLAGCGGGGGDCSDGVDNDGDGLIDNDDVACAFGQDNEAPDPVVPQCADGQDNDSDGAADFPEDPGCKDAEDDDEINEPVAQCKDGIDNDGDGKVDSPNDPGCELSLDDDESDDCPDGAGCPACGNGTDDDGDGDADYPDDPGCDNAADQDEFNSISGACGTAPIQGLPVSGQVTGTLQAGGQNALTSPTCSGTGSEIVYQFTLDAPRAATFTTDFPETEVDTVIYVRSADCQDPDGELACNDDAAAGETFGSTITIPELAAGTYYLVVDGRSNGSEGEFKLQASLFTSAGAPCDAAANECPPGHLCQRATAVATEDTCEPPRCGDGRDFDGDTKGDFPADPGCTSAVDNDEADDCPSGPNCPQCGNGNDDDGDGQADFPNDAQCVAASGDAEILLCAVESSAVVDITAPLTNGTTVGAGDELEGTCGNSNDGDETTYRLTVPGTLTTMSLNTNGSALTDTTIYVRQGSCTATTDFACDDDSGDGFLSSLTRTNVPAGTYFVTVAAYSDSTTDNTFRLNVSGTIATGQPCDPAQIASGLFTCQGGGACNTTCQ